MKNFILASASPRRKEIFKQIGIDIKVVESSINESIRTDERPEQIAMSLAFQKAIDVSNKVDNSIIIAADTIVVKENEIIGKPKNKLDARKTLQSLSGQKHSVITGFALIDNNRLTKIVDYELTEVYFKDLDTIEIEAYLETYEYLDKAGSYAIQGKGSLLVEKINGCYFNVVGLPISKINDSLKKYFDISLI
ncbi:septum formation inhibitor Maf [Soehngenia longivitae]|uniref:dTTP/UTP pyrophosphatase n=1 Tax=Soehngenia longivitae TaxID=2562294 RepID=A0A4Z0D5L2_9FIRM|nr:Maf family protein [Soehngenia longivitae]TFZ40012.1 septum formation inhibitor Maf [Soehngenia longivitae]